MTTKAITEIKAEDENGKTTDVRVSLRQDASDDMAMKVIQSRVSDDGRSNFFWFRLASGDLVLGVYPTGDMYFETELDRSI